MANKYLTENMYVNDRQELLDYIKTHSVKTFEPGREGVCNLLDNGQVVKYLHDEYNPKFVFQFSDLDIPSFIFTKTSSLFIVLF